MKKKVKGFFTALKELWVLSGESIRIVKGYSKWMYYSKYFTVILQAFRMLGFASLFSLLAIYVQSAGFDPKKDVQKFFWAYGGFIAFMLILGSFIRGPIHAFKIKYDNYIKDYLRDKLDEQLMKVGPADRISGIFINIVRRIDRGGLEWAIKNLAEMRSYIISCILALIVSGIAVTWISPWVIIVMIIPAMISTRLKIIHQKRLIARKDQINSVEARLSVYRGIMYDADTFIQSFFLKTLPFFRSKSQEFKAKERLNELEQEMVELKSDRIVAWINVLPLAVFCITIYPFIVNADVPRVLILFAGYKSLEGSVFSLLHLCSRYDIEVDRMKDWNAFLAFKPSIDESNCTNLVLENTPVITLNHVAFSYPSSDKLAFSCENLTIKKGQTIALIGKNGSGKSTLISLLTKTRLPMQGTVCFDNISTVEVTQESITNHVCWIAGNTNLLTLPLYEAICGCELDDVDWERLKEAASITGVEQLITQLPHGWHTSLDTTEEHHIEGFSEGQRQRLNLTAALYRALDPMIYVVIFDEPMAHCDHDVKTLFYTVIQDMGKTVIAAIHDPSFIRLFDRIIKLEDGQVKSDTTN